MRVFTPVVDLVHDLRYAARISGRNPGFTTVAVLSIALAIGANLGVFGVFDAVFLKGLPVSDPDALIQVLRVERGQWQAPEFFSYPVFEHLRDGSRAMLDLFVGTAVRPGWLRWEGADQLDEQVQYQHVSGESFAILRVGTALGRTLSLDEDRLVGAHPVAIISYGYWQRRFERSPAVLGRRFQLDGQQFEIIGVARAGFFGTDIGKVVDIWLPVKMYNANELTWRRFKILGRRKSAATIEQSTALVQSLYRAMEQTTAARRAQEPEMQVRLIKADKGTSLLRAQYRRPVHTVMVVVALVLLIACANVANLLLARATSRQTEIAVRIGIGAGRSRLLRQFLAEGLLLAAVGSAVGLFIALPSGPLLLRMLSKERQPADVAVGLDWRLLAVAIGACVGTTLVVGLWPAVRASGINIDAALKGCRGAAGSGARRFRSAHLLVASQVALSLALAVTAALFLATLRNFAKLDVGIDRRNTIIAELRSTAQLDRQQRRILWTEVQRRVSEIPGVDAAAFADQALFTRNYQSVSIRAQDDSLSSNGKESYVLNVSPRYFETMGCRLLAGRVFDPRDAAADAFTVAVVNEAFAKKHLGSGAVVGKRFALDGPFPGSIEMIGVVRDVKYDSLRTAAPPLVYFPMSNPKASVVLMLRGGLDANSLAPAIRRKIAQVSGAIRVERIVRQNALIEDTIASERLIANISAFFAGVALLLSAIGLYGVLSYSVARRTHEIGVRLALGAQRRTVLWTVLRDSLAAVAVGALAGLALALASAHLLRSFLFGIQPTDPFAIAAAVAALAMVAAIASYMPSRRACGTDPLTALRYE